MLDWRNGPEYPRAGAWGASGTAARFDVDVTLEHIRQGQIGNSHYCPITLACRAVPARRSGERNPMHDARVSGGLIHWTHPKTGRHIAVLTPARVIRWLHDFDAGQFVVPFSFVVMCYGMAET